MSEELDPSEFVQRIRQLGEQRDQQDAERVRKLEEEIIQGRSERLARRAERARSLSPDKPNTPQSLHSPEDTPRSVQEKAAGMPTPTMEPPAPQSAREDSLQRLTGSPAQLLEDDEPKGPTPNATALGRAGTLSWQRRPQSGSTRRPLSQMSASAEKRVSNPAHDTPEPSSPAASTPSRDQIVQSLGAKDPSWFKQTPDRGIGSAAYQRSQDDCVSEMGSVSGRRQLPGMSRDSTAEPDASSPPPESLRSSSPSRNSSIRGSAGWSNRFSANTSVSGGDVEPTGKLKSPLPVLDSQKFAPSSEQGSLVDDGEQAGPGWTLAMSPTHGRILPERTERPASPTKGIGGFVQSAMLKRNDSLNKRWSTQTPQGPSRQNSTVSNRGGTTLSGYGPLSRPERPSNLSRDNSMEPSSRPGSSSSNLTITKDAAQKDISQKGEFVKPALPHHSHSKSVASTFSEGNRPQDETSPPSPSKRWSPTKSSWLESVLNKPEAPKPKQLPPQQPAWMAEISRIKQQRASVDLGKGGPLQSLPPETPVSGRISPIKDVQLKPASPRRSESPKEGEPTETVQPLPKPKPALSPKPPSVVKKESPPEESPSVDDKAETPKDLSNPTGPKPILSAARLSKDSPLSSPPTKPKPEMPPKKDFRANLKSRQTTLEAPKKDEDSEFQNVLGRLKKTETKNYVAPDTLKDNILRGKAGLAVTGGPKPSVRRDEFKESLISQKSAMLAKAQEQGSAALKRADSTSQQQATPEALAKRKALGRSDSTSNAPPPKEKDPAPEALSRQKSLKSSKPTIPEKQPLPATTPALKDTAKSSKLADRFNPGLAGILARGPPSMSMNSSSNSVNYSTGESVTKVAEEENKGSAPELTHMTKGRARGPKRRAPATKKTVADTTSTPSKVPPLGASQPVKTENVLPSNDTRKTTEQATNQLVMRTPAQDSLKAKPTAPAKSPDLSKKLEKSLSPEIPRKSASLEVEKTLVDVENTPSKSAPPEIGTAKAPSPSPNVSNWTSSTSLTTPPSISILQKEPSSALREIAPPNGEASPTREVLSSSPSRASFSVKNATALWGQQSSSSSTPARTKSPIKLPTKADEKAAMESAGLVRTEELPETKESKPQAPKPKPLGLGLGNWGGFGLGAKSRESSPSKPLLAKSFPASPPTSADRPQFEPFKASPAPEKADGVFADFFDEPPVTNGEIPINIDALAVLKSPPIDLVSGNKIRTLRKQIQEISGDGKLSNIPIQEEHVLFQDSMYLCTHVFGDSKGARTTEVYLWSGNGVADATSEDARLFARNIASHNQGKLIVFRQGKETPNFFEALGGIIITRRGSRPASKEYMLCGRRHLGHLTFDEVNYSLKSLCSGFPYLICTESGKQFLWKGRGCSAEELSGARLMGMDLTATGELIEIDEGAETPELFNIFPPHEGKGPAIPRSADHWRYKATADRYQVRLFRIEQRQGSSGWGSNLQVSNFFAPLLRRPSWQTLSSPSTPTEQRPQTPGTPKSPGAQTTIKVVEIMPFTQRDLEPEFIYVLDAFFEMYIVVGALSKSQAKAFGAALLFAQEYSILAVSEEDRPFVPVPTVVLEGTPRDMKAVFRSWDDAVVPAGGLMRGKLGRGKSLRIMGIEKAIEATRQ
ncbi:hypothetical protein CC78DRAFT_620675 [Lojkania enalia]|uniref:DUF4045 domain-containing protein n=1 Tax=Lojkania enalia TaxID=147567 RepID=A0A9P4K0H5_9PLEO|nr:hypothetical protein CC78DRAFT_620675 [Didymosphaeria enalia]